MTAGWHCIGPLAGFYFRVALKLQEAERKFFMATQSSWLVADIQMEIVMMMTRSITRFTTRYHFFTSATHSSSFHCTALRCDE